MIENTELWSSYRSKCKVFVTCMLGFVTMSIMQSNLGIALVDRSTNNSIRNEQRQLHRHEQNLLISAFLYGNLFAPIGGALVRRFDPFWLYNCGLTVMALLTILSPVVIHRNLFLFALCRLTMGTFQALARTSLIQRASSWKTRRTAIFFVALIAVGNNFGIAISYTFTIFLINTVGWDESFYAVGTLSFLIVILGALFAGENWQKKSDLSRTIEACIEAQYEKSRRKSPYVTILTSKSVCALNYIKFTLAGGMSCSMYYGPQFIKSLQEDSSLPIIGYLSSILNLGPLVAYPASALLLACLLDTHCQSAAQVHRINFYFGSTLAIAFMLFCAICSSATHRICSLALFQTFVCFADLTTQIVPLYLTPKYAGFLSSLGTLSRTLGSISLPLLWRYIESLGSADEWKSNFVFIALLTSLIIPTFVLISFEPLPGTADNDAKKTSSSPKLSSDRIEPASGEVAAECGLTRYFDCKNPSRVKN